jgi:hypothetical protein
MMKMLAVGIVLCLLGCVGPVRIETSQYSPFVVSGRAVHGWQPDDGKLSIWFSPEAYGHEIQGLTIHNIVVPEGSMAKIGSPSWAKGEQWLTFRIANVNDTEEADFSWDIHQDGVFKQSIHVTIIPTPKMNVIVDGESIDCHESNVGATR